ncbi:hypothetical protein [Calothrix sp. CCY 0018]|uniref:hypothetical protein n=1 Tax=Calothrix sp. CCY 0018 TaxID=3103864 RepID=UPI0039C6C3F0
MLVFAEQIKELIYDVEMNGGNPLQKILPPSSLLQNLKAYAISFLQEIPTKLPDCTTFFLEELKDGYFDKCIRNCFIHLAEIGITKPKEVERILTIIVKKRVEVLLDDDGGSFKIRRNSQMNVDEAIVDSLTSVWEENGSDTTFLYNIAKDRFLISWNYTRKCWEVTGLGRFILSLEPIQLIIFILSIDSIVNTNNWDERYIYLNILKEIHHQNNIFIDSHIVCCHEKMLKSLGILRVSLENSEYTLTPLGKVVIERVLSEDNPMKDITQILIDGENKGIKFESAEKELEVFKNELNLILDESIKKSLQNGINLYERGSYIDALKIFFPSIEAVANRMLLEVGENPDDRKKFSGLSNKLKKLEELKLISPDLSMSIDITTGRNKVLHGQYEPQEQEYVYPLCVASIIYLRRIFSEYKKVKQLKK